MYNLIKMLCELSHPLNDIFYGGIILLTLQREHDELFGIPAHNIKCAVGAIKITQGLVRNAHVFFQHERSIELTDSESNLLHTYLGAD